MDIIVRNLAFASACGGTTSAWIESTDPQTYQKRVLACASFGDAVGNALSIDLNAPDATFKIIILNTICVSALQGRYPLSTVDSDYNAIATAIVALYNEAVLNLLPVPMTAVLSI